MKKTALLLCLPIFGLTSFAQTVNIHFQNGTTVNFHEDLIESIDFSEKTPDPTLTAGDAVDLGLSVMWASCNLGATQPEEYGGYYAWGETSEKDSYDKDNYAYYNASTAVYTSIGAHISGTEYDAAHVNLGGGWRMPTKAQYEELFNKCSWTWTNIDGTNGYLIKGSNGNSIFLPAAGGVSGKWYHNQNTHGNYWSDYRYDDGWAYELYFYSSDKYTGSRDYKHYGYTIRPIISYDDYNGTADYDDSAVTSKISAYYAGGTIMSNGDVILSGSKLNFYFKNGSEESVLLTEVKLIENNGTQGNNLLSSDITVAAGESPGYTITLGKNMTKPKCRFTYRYNNHTYYIEAAYQSFNMAKGMMHELNAE